MAGTYQEVLMRAEIINSNPCLKLITVIHLKSIYVLIVSEHMKLYGSMVQVIKHISMMIFLQLDCIERNVSTVMIETHEFMDIIKHLVREKKDLQKRLDVMEEIMHSYLPIIGEDEQENSKAD